MKCLLAITVLLIAANLFLGCASADGVDPSHPDGPSPGAQHESCQVSEGIEYIAWQDDYNTHVWRKVLANGASVVRTLPADVWEANFPSGPVSVDPYTLDVCEI